MCTRKDLGYIQTQVLWHTCWNTRRPFNHTSVLCLEVYACFYCHVAMWAFCVHTALYVYHSLELSCNGYSNTCGSMPKCISVLQPSC